LTSELLRRLEAKPSSQQGLFRAVGHDKARRPTQMDLGSPLEPGKTTEMWIMGLLSPSCASEFVHAIELKCVEEIQLLKS